MLAARVRAPFQEMTGMVQYRLTNMCVWSIVHCGLVAHFLVSQRLINLVFTERHHDWTD